MSDVHTKKQPYDVLSILTLVVGIFSVFWFIFLPVLGGILGIVGIILAAKARRQREYNRKLVKWGGGISLITRGIIAILLPLTLIMEFVKFIS
ncbi:hypothetical protein NSQ54_09915 [Alkalihalobacillus sp. FSL W8-0930]